MSIDVTQQSAATGQAETTALINGSSEASATGWRRWWTGRFGWKLAIEIVLVVTVYRGYKWARRLTNDQYSTAFAHARRVASWEGRVGMLIEDNLQRVALGYPDIIWLLNRYYAYVHFTASLSFLIWLYVRHGDVYLRIRRVLLATTVTGLVMHVAFPLAPPRMFPSMGFVDTITRFGPRIYDDARVAATVNQIAAMPSLHFGWAVIVAWGVVRSLRHPLRWLVVLHPLITLAAIVLTGNHWWLDAAVAGVIVLTMAWIDDALFPRSGFPLREKWTKTRGRSIDDQSNHMPTAPAWSVWPQISASLHKT